jgi:hypothetical protein
MDFFLLVLVLLRILDLVELGRTEFGRSLELLRTVKVFIMRMSFQKFYAFLLHGEQLTEELSRLPKLAPGSVSAGAPQGTNGRNSVPKPDLTR